MWASAGPGPSSSSPNQWKSDGSVKINNSVSARSNYRERSNIKSASGSALTGSVPRKMVEALHKVCFQHSLGFEPMLPDSLQPVDKWLTTKPLVRIYCSKKRFMTRRISPPATDFLRTGLLYSDFQDEYQGQTRYTRILERKSLIDKSYRMLHRLELKYFHFAQFLLNAH